MPTLNDEQAEIVQAVWKIAMENMSEPYNEICDALDMGDERAAAFDKDGTYNEANDPVVQRVAAAANALFDNDPPPLPEVEEPENPSAEDEEEKGD